MEVRGDGCMVSALEVSMGYGGVGLDGVVVDGGIFSALEVAVVE